MAFRLHRILYRLPKTDFLSFSTLSNLKPSPCGQVFRLSKPSHGSQFSSRILQRPGACRAFHSGTPQTAQVSSFSAYDYSGKGGNTAYADSEDEVDNVGPSGINPSQGPNVVNSNGAPGVPGAGEGLAISSLGICNEIVQALANRGIHALFPIQRAVLEPAMSGRDLIARAKTGTGKTLAFGIPVMDHILREMYANNANRYGVRRLQALILAPTRELAKQVQKEFVDSAPGLASACLYGGTSIMAQQRDLQRGVNLVVGTPGRILDLIERRSLILTDVKFLILDEADLMLDIGFKDDIEKVLRCLPTNRQTMLFSATMPPWIKSLARNYLKDPLTIDLVGEDDEKIVERIKVLAVNTGMEDKRPVLCNILSVYNRGKCIVFTKTKRDADNIASMIGRSSEPLHGDITQNQRERTLYNFREGRINVLVATDVAARGIDVPNVDLVVHYEIPGNSETFVHRSGRTGRAGKTGTAIVMHTYSESNTIRNFEADVGRKFQAINPPTVQDVQTADSTKKFVTSIDLGPEPRYSPVRSSSYGGGGYGGGGYGGGRSGGYGGGRTGGYGGGYGGGSSGGYGGGSSYGGGGGYGGSSSGGYGGGSGYGGGGGSYGGSSSSYGSGSYSSNNSGYGGGNYASSSYGGGSGNSLGSTGGSGTSTGTGYYGQGGSSSYAGDSTPESRGSSSGDDAFASYWNRPAQE